MEEAAFIGLNVSVKLKEPPVALTGLVSDVKGQRLYLTHVYFVKSRKRLKEYTIHGSEIADIDVLPQPPIDSTSPSQLRPLSNSGQSYEHIEPLEPSNKRSSPSKPSEQAFSRGDVRSAQVSGQPPAQFSDPAILSFARSQLAPTISSNPNPQSSKEQLSLPTLKVTQSGALQPALSGGGATGYHRNEQSTLRTSDLDHPTTLTNLKNTAELTNNEKLEDVQRAPLDEQEDGLDADEGTIGGFNSRPDGPVKSARRRKRGKGKPKPGQAGLNIDTSPEYDKKGLQSPAVGWRQTPILEQQPKHVHLDPSSNIPESKTDRRGRQTASSTKKSKRRRDFERETANGWATEEASDVHGLGDFDFEANLSKFDKLAVWDELRNGDTTADEDRLVSLNRVKGHQPGTFGGRKLLPSENVLDRPRLNSRDLALADDDDDDLDIYQIAAPRRLHRDASKTSDRQPVSGKVSLAAEANSIAPIQGSQRSFTNRSLSQAKVSDSQGGASPRAQGFASPASSSIFSPTAAENRSEPALRYDKSDRKCRTMTPETLEAVENLAHNGFGISEDILAENAGRGIAQIILSAISPKGHRLGQPDHNPLPVVVFLVGDNKAGGRALAAARHLLERNVRVVASLTGPVDLENGPFLSSQIHRFKGKFLRTWEETSAYLKTLDAPPELIVDAILGLEFTFDDLAPDHRATAMEMVAWANKSKASVVAIDLPSGVDAWDGTVQIREGEPAELRARLVICCGVPCSGLLQSVISRHDEDKWKMFVVDIGLNPAARPFLKLRTNKAASHSRGKYIQFGSDWIVGIRYDPGSAT